MRTFAPSPIASLIDEIPLYDLAESTSQDLTIAELLGADGVAALAERSLGYATSTGDEELRQLLGAHLGVPHDRVLVTSGAAAALFLLGLLFADAGEVVVVTPCFPPTLDAVRGLGATVVTAPLGFDDGFRLDTAAVESAMSADTRLVMLASPQNPAGVRFTDAELERLLAVMSRVCPDALLFVDETFRDSTHGDDPVPASSATLSPRVVTCGSLSKAHGAPGLRIGWLTAPTAELYEQLRLAKFNTALACGSLDEVLAVELVKRSPQVLAPRRAFLAEALTVVESFVERYGDLVEWVRPDAGAFCCVRLRPEAFGPDDVQRFHAELRRRRVSVAPGSWFGDSDAVFRLGFGHESMEGLRAGLDHIGEVLKG